MLVLAVLAAALGVWWGSDGRMGIAIAWFVVAIGYALVWHARRRARKTPWWARRVGVAHFRRSREDDEASV
jgi:hypothetical protein